MVFETPYKRAWGILTQELLTSDSSSYHLIPTPPVFGKHFTSFITNIKHLRNRPAWRGFTDELIKKHISFNPWFKDNAHKTKPPITLLDTSKMTVNQSVEEVARWINVNYLN